ncbi:MAG: DUF4912 domain-containing protein [Prochlorothrix sp.]|nr:DUF4912 domain-containing protein [Prochlorothrix sp.]
MVSKRPPLEDMTLRQLRRVASIHGIARYSRMRKAQLLLAIRAAERMSSTASTPRRLDPQEEVEAAKFNLGPSVAGGATSLFSDELNSVDENLPGLPEGYGESRIVLMPRDPLWAYVYWDIPNDHRERLRRQGGQDLTLRIYDVTNVDFDSQPPHSVQIYGCDELARDWYLPITVSDRDYLVEIGYGCRDGRWLVLARSSMVRVPPVYPSEWAEEHFVEVQWQEDLATRRIYVLTPPETLPGQGLERSTVGSRYLNGHTTGSGHHLQSPSSHTNGSSYFQDLTLLSYTNVTLPAVQGLVQAEGLESPVPQGVEVGAEGVGRSAAIVAPGTGQTWGQGETKPGLAAIVNPGSHLAMPVVAYVAPAERSVSAVPQPLGGDLAVGQASVLGQGAVAPGDSIAEELAQPWAGWWPVVLRQSPKPQWSAIAQGSSCAGVLPLPSESRVGWCNLELGWSWSSWEFPTFKGVGSMLWQLTRQWLSAK